MVQSTAPTSLPPMLSLVLVVSVLGMVCVAQDQAERFEPEAADIEASDTDFSDTDFSDTAAAERAGREDFYPLLELFADALDQVDRNYVKEVDRRKLMEAAIRGVLSELDPYSEYISPEALARFRQGVESRFGGIGIQISIDAGRLTILSPLVDTPAYRAGLMPGDRIIKIDGLSTEGFTIDNAVRHLEGAAGTEVTLTVVHPHDPAEKEVTLKREVIRVRTVMGTRRKADDSWDFMLDDDAKIGYVRITAFGRPTASELRKTLDRLTAGGMRGLILDLRFNPGGLLSSAIDVSDMFIRQGRIVATKSRNAAPLNWNAHDYGTFGDFEMAVLVNRFSASAAEIVAACLKDHGRAVVIGRRTWGKGSVQNVIELEGGRSILKLTTASYHRPNGQNIHRFPDSAEDDPWGVRPSAGFEVRFDAAQNRRLLAYWRSRHVVAPGDDGQPEDAAAENDPPNAENDENDENDENAENAATPFVDRQLAKAVEYIEGRLAEKAGENSPLKK